MIVIRGDSMLSGFPTTSALPVSCLAPHTRISEQRVVSIADALGELIPGSIACCAPGVKTDVVMDWLERTPQWWGSPTVFSFGFNDRPQCVEAVLPALQSIAERLTAPWLYLAMPITANQVASGRANDLIDANAEIASHLGERFFDPVGSVFGQPCIPEESRIDVVHPTTAASRRLARAIADELIRRQWVPARTDEQAA